MTARPVLRRPSVEPNAAPAPALLRLEDEVFDATQAAAFLKVSEAWVLDSDAPRASLAQGGRANGPQRFLKSQLLAWLLSRHSYTINPEAPRE
jgi:hypothetical protein